MQIKQNISQRKYQKNKSIVTKLQIIKKIIMYFGKQILPTNSIFHLTGQLTVQLSPQQYSHRNKVSPFTQSDTQTTQFVFQETHTREKLFSSANSQSRIQELQNKMKYMEEMMQKNIEIINYQTLDTSQEIKASFQNTVRTQNQIFQEKIQILTQVEQQWHQKGESLSRLRQQIREREQKLKNEEQNFKKQINEQVRKMFEEEKIKSELIRDEKYDAIREELEKERMKREVVQQKFAILVKEYTLEEKNFETEWKIEELEQRMSLRFKNEAERVEVMNNKIEEIKEICQKAEEELRKTGERMQLASMIDLTTPFVGNFHLDGKMVRLKEEVYREWTNEYQQVLLATKVGKEPFTFHVHINQLKTGAIIVGVVDRLTQKQQQNSHASRNAVCYDGAWGYINYVNCGEFQYKQTSIKVHSNTEVGVKVDLPTKTVTFIIKQDGNTNRKSVQSQILSQPDRQFVPFFQMRDKDDQLTWAIE